MIVTQHDVRHLSDDQLKSMVVVAMHHAACEPETEVFWRAFALAVREALRDRGRAFVFFEADMDETEGSGPGDPPEDLSHWVPS